MSWPVPMPALPMVILPGWALARAINSCTFLTGSDGCTIRMLGWFARRTTGAKSLSESNPVRLYRNWFAASTPELVTNSVLPSAGARATNSAAMLPDAPGRLSTTIGCPSASPSFFATLRATVSTLPPGGKGTTSRMAPEGHVWADTLPAARSASASRPRRMRLTIMYLSLLIGIVGTAGSGPASLLLLLLVLLDGVDNDLRGPEDVRILFAGVDARERALLVLRHLQRAVRGLADVGSGQDQDTVLVGEDGVAGRDRHVAARDGHAELA